MPSGLVSRALSFEEPCLKLRDVSPEADHPWNHRDRAAAPRAAPPCITMWIVRLVGSIATLELKATGPEYGPGALNEANAIDFATMVLTSQDQR